MLPTNITVKMGDQSTANINLSGKIQIFGKLVDALYAPNFRFNLISVPALTNIKFKITFEKDYATISKDLITYGIAKINPDNNLYLLEDFNCGTLQAEEGKPEPMRYALSVIKVQQELKDAREDMNKQALIHKNKTGRKPNGISYYRILMQPFNPYEMQIAAEYFPFKPEQNFRTATAFLNTNEDNATNPKPLGGKRNDTNFLTWHRRLGHACHEKTARTLKMDQRACRIPSKEDFWCNTCSLSKAVQRTGKDVHIPKTTILYERVHMDVAGPFRSESLGGKKYYVCIIEDSTRYGQIFTCVDKTEVYEKWMIYVKRATNNGFRIQEVRSDNGTEFARPRQDMKDRGIAWRPAPPYTQHANGVAERFIRSINTRARALLIDALLPDWFWNEAVGEASILHSYQPQKILGGISPYEARYGKQPCLKHIRVFGCLAYRWLAPKQRKNGKWMALASPGMCLGNAENSTTIYRIWDFVEEKIYYASNVTFREDVQAWPNFGSTFTESSNDIFCGYYEIHEPYAENVGDDDACSHEELPSPDPLSTVTICKSNDGKGNTPLPFPTRTQAHLSATST